MTSPYLDTLLFIDGRWRPGSGGETIAVHDPATGSQIGTVAKAGRPDLEEALAAAARGFESWRRTSPFERAALMRKAADNLRAAAHDVAHRMTLEQGKPLAQSRMETLAGADIIDWFAGEAPRAYGQTIPSRAPDVVQMTMKVPVGPVAAFTPWNFPINQAVRKVSAALAAGCSVILKAPEETPASPAMLVRAFVEAGLPPGVISLVFGDPAKISNHLIPHPVVQKISFTGSTQVGKQLASLAGLHMKRMTMELGGHAPVIVAGDADLETAVKTMVAAKFRNAGQICVAPTRFLVQDDIAGDFIEAFASQARSLRIGSGLDPDVEMGPLANHRRVLALEGLVQDAVSHGAKLVTGGRRIGNAGNFFEPTVLADVPVGARIMNEEPFGPVAIVNRFTTLDEAIREANRLRVGLASFGFTQSSAVATRLANEVAAGMMSINHYGLALPEVPFGGIGDSGYGTEGGSEALDGYFDTRFVTRRG
ncbi:NAD-dependent succinate-semialdehyde dehydrogenase [Aquamicrobium defluvii]|uniref:Aldehyde dehydrogenase n=1 Tax=Aquamicrobium defluvii TaxID=69279 RepID=A0A011VQ90_9HYPH|nr:NAD-dependent succinate-semialdehyde dehydrogenase [Aquamicrobium defluvii]EXL10545.1 aldehyde dehydrogenase [Aquamicrobium defluvii]EZQ17721.1 aldehyde dehydrogenase [Halopseudomonas bauzanensis]